MTGGRAVILGPTGLNFAAGMSGGIAYVLDEAGDFETHLNPLAAVDLDPLGEDDVEYLQNILRKHFDYTRSGRAEEILRKWDTYAPKFVKVFPTEYREALEKMAAQGITPSR
jgi:glutamate synthase domain-containing protein 3